ncbi:UbiX family flavin prenyltransferase [Vampirovibrio sp.]|uniref:UbiX family flavin prenyltransferase n=1 Tax=Vampirovibrio sp. TaxID=2717857 RepID=UPI003593F40E
MSSTTSTPPNQSPVYPPVHPIVVGITGASGSILGFRLIEELLRLDRKVQLVMTEKSYQVIFEETGFKIGGQDKALRVLAHLGLPESKLDCLQVFENNRLDAPPSSGTHMTHGMVVIPCSMGTLGRIANGITDTLVARAADVTLKEHRKLIVVPRESPFNQIHLRNLMTLSQCGAVIMPPMLTFYLPDFGNIEGQINYTVGKVLDQFGLGHDLYTRWGQHIPAPEMAGKPA